MPIFIPDLTDIFLYGGGGTGGGGGPSTPPAIVGGQNPAISGTSPYYVGSSVTGTQGVYDDPGASISNTFQYNNGSGWTDTTAGLAHVIASNHSRGNVTGQLRMKEDATNAFGTTTTYSNVLNLYNWVVDTGMDGVWLDLDDSDTVSTSGSNITNVLSKAITAWNFGNAVGANQPIFSTAGGRGSMSHPDDGAAHWLENTDASLIAAMAGEHWMFIIYNVDGNRASQALHRLWTGSTGAASSRNQMMKRVTAGPALQYAYNSANTAATSIITDDTNFHLAQGSRIGTTAEVRYDSDAANTQTASAVSLTRFRTGSQAGGVLVDSLYGKIREVIVVAGNPGATELGKIRAYLNSKHGVTV